MYWRGGGAISVQKNKLEKQLNGNCRATYYSNKNEKLSDELNIALETAKESQ